MRSLAQEAATFSTSLFPELESAAVRVEWTQKKVWHQRCLSNGSDVGPEEEAAINQLISHVQHYS